MAHIADLMIDPASMLASNKYSSPESSPHTTYERSQTPERGLIDGKEKDKYVWRMHQPSQPPRYQLFPSSSQEKLAITTSLGRKTPELDQTLPNATTAKGNAAEGPSPTNGLKREPNLGRRRKPSVTDLGHMATVQEVAMDSPTIPGRFPVHERSISAPGEPSWRQNVFGESMFAAIEGPVVDIKQRRVSRILQRRNYASPSSKMHSRHANRLAPLIIPTNMNDSPGRDTFPKRVLNRLSEQSSLSDTPPEVPPKSARMLSEASPQSGLASSLPSLPSVVPTVTPFSPFTPLSDFSASTASLVPLKLAPGTSTSSPQAQGRASPAPKGSFSTRKPSPTPRNHTRGLSESSSFAVVTRPGHRRTESEASIMDRGRPKKRADGSSIKSATTKAQEQRAFITLPTGVKASDAPSKFSPQDIEALRQQAQGQAAQFEVLASKHVGDLSRELRALDERCEYLRRTHRSLRSGRRNLHDRICSYLRSPRVARFSHDAILKQEEALSELDASIDDWVSKVEYAENRRTRVRQKLFEHVAAALMMPSQRNEIDNRSIPEYEAINILHSPATANHTPPRSPTKALSPSPIISSSKRRASPEPEAPARLARPVPPQLSTSPPPPHTLENEPFNERHRDSHSTAGRPSAESIRIYADSDVYALLADVEQEIHRMGQGVIEEEVLLSQMKYEAPPRCETPKSGTSRSGTPTGIERMKGLVKEQLRVAGLVG
ncbi:hypothetical protein GMDG_06545 [Pseudogymnoascus destructans 20631-21]|uniref:Up-regulated during septation protein 1 domain-containing protein n=2 Tax=Pseudogymnoascus destructans TaxID=655981 RepID=L8FU28_PSED2|nr:hypothetical protein GMDG_06545 [Pseudogymnoascus destructans 20631-21]